MKYDMSADNQSVDKTKITLAGNGGTTITNVKSALAGVKDADNKDATIATATGDALKNAVNLGDLQNVYNEVNSKAEKANTSHTALTVEGGKAAGTEDGSYTGDNILLHATTDKETGKVTYDLKLNNDIMIGNKGKDGVSITGPQGEAGKDGIDGKVGISGKDGKDAVSITGKDGVGHIGLTGPKGADGTPGASIDITVKNGYNEQGKDGKDGINGEKGVDGNNLTRVVYTDKTGEHQIATMEDGLKFKGDDETVISKKLNNTLEIIGGADSKKLTEGNIGVVSENGKLNVRLAKDLTGLNSTTYTTTTGEGESATTSTTVVNGNGLTIKNGPSITNNGIDGGSEVITNVGSGIEKGSDGKYTVTKDNTSNAANIGDVDNMVNQAVKGLSDATDTKLADKANVNASNIGANISSDTDKQKANEEAWGDALGKGEIKAGEKRLVTGDTVAKAIGDEKTAREAADQAINEKIGTLDKDGNYIKKDDSISKNLSTLDGQVKNNADAISKISSDVSNLSDNAVQYDKDTNKSKVTLAGEDGTTITNVKNGALNDKSTDAVNGQQLYNEQRAREAADKAITDTLYKEVHVDKDGSYIKSSNTVGQNLSELDKGLKTTSDLIHTNDKGDTIQIGGNSTATKIDVSGKDAKGNTTGRVITGVITDASDRNSAANVGYVEANTQQIYREMNNAYGNLNRNINRAAAGSNALAALHPLDYDPADKASFAVGYGHYRNANAAAIGAFYYPNANTMVNVGVSVGNGDPGINAGVSFKLGQGSAYNGVSKAEMAQTIHDQATEISAIKADDAAKDKRIDALEKENQEMKKQIQEILARLNG